MSKSFNPGPVVEPADELSRDELARYARHLSLPGIGLEGQRRLRAASVLVIGAGGLGAPVLQYLAAAGVGALTVIDDDIVETSNLQRQILHRDADVSRAKVDSARDALLRLDPNIQVRAIRDRLSPDNALDLFTSHDLVIDGADNFATRYLSNDAAELTGTPLVWGTIFRFSGQVSTFVPDQGPMLRDLFPDIPEADSVPDCAEGGVFGVLCGTVGSAMATEAIKLICGIGFPYIGRLLRYDALSGESRTLRFFPDPDRPPVTDLAEVALACAARDRSADDGATAGQSASRAEIGLAEFLAGDGDRLLIDVREDWERELSAIPASVHVPLGEVRERGWAAVAPLIDTGAEPERVDTGGHSEIGDTGRDRQIVVHCKSGTRSAEAVDILAASAPTQVRIRSLSGGIDAWAARTGAGSRQDG